MTMAWAFEYLAGPMTLTEGPAWDGSGSWAPMRAQVERWPSMNLVSRRFTGTATGTVARSIGAIPLNGS